MSSFKHWNLLYLLMLQRFVITGLFIYPRKQTFQFICLVQWSIRSVNKGTFKKNSRNSSQRVITIIKFKVTFHSKSFVSMDWDYLSKRNEKDKINKSSFLLHMSYSKTVSSIPQKQNMEVLYVYIWRCVGYKNKLW